MATRYPLIVNSSSNQIQEMPFGDTLSLVGNDVDQIIVSGISTLGRVTISSGIVTASSGIVTYYGDGSKLSSISVASTAISDSTAADAAPELLTELVSLAISCNLPAGFVEALQPTTERF